jgi:hypothetical protein
MEIIAFTLPFIVAIILLIFFRKETTPKEYVLLILPSIVIFFVVRLIMFASSSVDTEYLGDYITKVRHYDEWDEWVHRTCTRTYKVGNTTRVQTYDCSYRRYHPEKWSYFDSRGKEHSIYSKKEFEKVKNKFNSKMVFVDMKRRYYRIDGDAQDYYWNKTKETSYTVTSTNLYKNKIQNSRSIFGFEEITKKQAKELGLFDYPCIECLDQIPVLSDSFYVSKQNIDAIKYINGFYGRKYQFRLYILLFPYDKGVEISELQRSYWCGGNKNELVVCLGMKDNTQIGWCNAFSWCDSPKLDLLTEQYFNENDSLDLIKYSNLITEGLERGDWKRKEFNDFEYIRRELSNSQCIWLVILLLLYNIGISIYIITNDIKNKNYD